MQEIVDYARFRQPQTGKRMKFYATTNGTLANDQIERVIKDGQIELLISMDGRPGTHDFRPRISGKNSYPQLQRNLSSLFEWSPRSVVRMTFHPQSLDLVDNVAHALEMGASSVCLCPVVEADWTGFEEQLEAAYEQLGDWFLQEYRAGRTPPLEITWRLLKDYSPKSNVRPCKACGLGTSLLSVDPDGRVLPCHRFLYHKDHMLGTVSESELPQQRWDYVHLPRAEVPDCTSCVARSVCGGGCRLVALEGGHGLQGVHPNHCLLLRAHVRQITRILREVGHERRFMVQLHFMNSGSQMTRELFN